MSDYYELDEEYGVTIGFDGLTSTQIGIGYFTDGSIALIAGDETIPIDRAELVKIHALLECCIKAAGVMRKKLGKRRHK